MVDPRVRHSYIPLAHEAVSGARVAHDITFDSPAFVRARGGEWITGAARTIDAPARTVTLFSGDVLPYDRCVIAVGSISDVPPHLIAASTVVSAKWVSDALALREKLYGLRARSIRNARVVVAGCALTAVEWSAELATTRIDGMGVEVTMIGASRRLLNEFAPNIGQRAAHILESLGVKLHFGRSVIGLTEEAVRTNDGHEHGADLLVWAGGVRPNPALLSLGIPLGDDGRVLVTPRLAVLGMDGLYAIGDAAQITESGITWPTMVRAIEAIWQGKTLARRFSRGFRDDRGFTHRLRPDFWYGLSLGKSHSAIYRGSWMAEHPRLVTARRWLQRMYYRRFR